jgi:hypothetical protein
MPLIGTAIVFAAVIVLLTPSIICAQSDPGLQKKIATYEKQLAEQSRRIDGWQQQANEELALLIVAGLLGGLTAALQALDRPWIKICTACVGAAIGTITVVTDNAFLADRKSLIRAVSVGQNLVSSVENDIANLEPSTPPPILKAQTDAIWEKVQQIFELQPGFASTTAQVASSIKSRSLTSLFPSVPLYAQGRQPDWISRTPVDDAIYNFSVGKATASSLEDAKDEAFHGALQAAAARVASKAPVDVVGYIKTIAKVADVYFTYDVKTKTVTYWTLIRVPKQLATAALVEQLADEDYITVFRKGVKAAQARDWKTSAQQMQTAIARQPAANPVKQVSIQGMRSEPYAPHYYLGVALSELKDCDGSMEAFSRAESEVKDTPLAHPLKIYAARCESTKRR